MNVAMGQGMKKSEIEGIRAIMVLSISQGPLCRFPLLVRAIMVLVTARSAPSCRLPLAGARHYGASLYAACH